jgi:membrane protease subunit (stomatin/prohibitin family)
MGILNTLRHELIDIIEWLDDRGHTLVWRYPRYQNEIKHGASLIVRPGQSAVLVDRGKIADVFEPGTYALNTPNIPILSTLRGWAYGFESPFKCEVYFVSTRTLTDLKWGTPNAIMLRDPEFGPIRLRAFGVYTLRALDARTLLRELVGTDGIFEADEVTELLRAIIASSFAELIGQAHATALDLAAQYGSLGDSLRKRVCERIDDEYGLEIPQLHIVNIGLPKEVEEALDTRSRMNVLGDMQRYQQYQSAQSIPLAATNPNGATAAVAGLAVGVAMAASMGNGTSLAATARKEAAPGPAVRSQITPVAAEPASSAPSAAVWHVAVDGAPQGPFDIEHVQRGIVSGQYSAQTLVWTPGMVHWTAAATVMQLASCFAPPPLPSAPLAT